MREAPRGEVALLFCGPPALLVGVHLFPGSGAWRLSLAADSLVDSPWTLWTAFASSYVHVTSGHLLNNVGIYWLLTLAVYPLAGVAGWRRRLAAAAGAYLLVVPVASAWLTLAALGSVTDLPTAGFSDVNAAFLGFLLAVWFAAFDQATGGALDPRWAGVVFLASLAAVLGTPGPVPYFPARPVAAAACAGLAVLTAGRLRRASGGPEPFVLSAPQEFCLVFGAGVAVAGLIGSMLVVPAGSNVYAHLAGYIVGFLLPFGAVLRDGG